jgi:hypothetical protein
LEKKYDQLGYFFFMVSLLTWPSNHKEKNKAALNADTLKYGTISGTRLKYHTKYLGLKNNN